VIADARLTPHLFDIPRYGNDDHAIARDLEDCGCAYVTQPDRELAQKSVEWTLAHTDQQSKDFMAELPPTCASTSAPAPCTFPASLLRPPWWRVQRTGRRAGQSASALPEIDDLVVPMRDEDPCASQAARRQAPRFRLREIRQCSVTQSRRAWRVAAEMVLAM
jgi:hypothetical protein